MSPPPPGSLVNYGVSGLANREVLPTPSLSSGENPPHVHVHAVTRLVRLRLDTDQLPVRVRYRIEGDPQVQRSNQLVADERPTTVGVNASPDHPTVLGAFLKHEVQVEVGSGFILLQLSSTRGVDLGEEIGRASCRELVCIWLVVRSVDIDGT